MSTEKTIVKPWTLELLLKESKLIFSKWPEWKKEFIKKYCPINNKINKL